MHIPRITYLYLILSTLIYTSHSMAPEHASIKRFQQLSQTHRRAQRNDAGMILGATMFASGILCTTVTDLATNLPTYLSPNNTHAPLDVLPSIIGSLAAVYMIGIAWPRAIMRDTDATLNQEFETITQQLLQTNSLCCVCHDDEKPAALCTLFACCGQTICKSCDSDVKKYGITTCPCCRAEHYETIDELLR